jgi:hypothetical protein
MRQIPLTQGQVALIDDEDFVCLSQYKWKAIWSEHTKSFYAARDLYAGRKCLGRVYMHRAILGLEIGDLRQGDHRISGQTLNNRRSNLRVATHGQNQQNRRMQINNTSGFRGVLFSKQKRKWQARLQLNGKQIHLGFFLTPEEAHDSWRQGAIQYYGEFANA